MMYPVLLFDSINFYLSPHENLINHHQSYSSSSSFIPLNIIDELDGISLKSMILLFIVSITILYDSQATFSSGGIALSMTGSR